MQTTYHIKAGDVNEAFVTTIKGLFMANEDLTITIESEKRGRTSASVIKRLSDLEEKYPPKRIDPNFDFNGEVDKGINL